MGYYLYFSVAQLLDPNTQNAFRLGQFLFRISKVQKYSTYRLLPILDRLTKVFSAAREYHEDRRRTSFCNVSDLIYIKISFH